MIIEVKVVEAKGLASKDPNGKSDPYCLIGIAAGDKYQDRNKCKKSSTCFQTLDPLFKNTKLSMYVCHCFSI